MDGADQLVVSDHPEALARNPSPRADLEGTDRDADVDSRAAAAPTVLALVIAREPGEWFATTLSSLARQDYERLAVVIVDVANTTPLDRVAARYCPQASVLSVPDDPGGFGATVNAAVERSPRAALYLICHDDVALADDAVSELVTEVLRSNAAVVGPKLVDWDDPDRLQHVGLMVDRLGAPIGVVDEGELDQEQYDAVTDVFALPGGCVMIRADLFHTIGGFDEGITFRGDDVDLCWRAQLAGARVMVVPAAVVRHRERLDESDRSNTYYLRLRHAMRSAWSCYSLPTLIRVLPLALVLSVFEFVYSMVTGRFGHGLAVAKAWGWNVARLGEIRRRRRAIAGYREIDDGEVRAMQARGSARVRAFVRGHGGDSDRLLAVTQLGRGYLASLRQPGTRYLVAFLGIVATIGGFGSRHLLTRPLPAIGEFQPLVEQPWALVRDWWSGWHAAGGGTNAPAPTGQLIVGIAGLLLFNSAGFLLKLLVLSPLLIGPIGAWRFCRAFGSARASVAGVAVYAVTPVAYDAIARGSWSGLVAYAALPFVARGLARVLEVAPFAVGDPGASGYPRSFDIVALGLALAVAAIAVPFIAVVAVLVALAFLVGSLLSGDDRGFGRLALGAGGALATAALLHLPWIGTWLHAPRTWATFGAAGTSNGGSLSFASLLRIGSGPFDDGYLGYVYGVPLVLAILVAQNWRLTWAARAGALVLCGVFAQWVSERGWLPVAMPDPTVLLSISAFGFAVGAALVAVAVEEDLPRYRLGWRQAVPVVAFASILAMTLPLARASLDGRWRLPSRGNDISLSFLDEPERLNEGSYRVAWIGYPSTMPIAGATFDHLAADGVSADGELALALTDSRGPQFSDRWAAAQSDTALGVADSLRGAVAGQTVRLGGQLAPYAVRYVVVVEYRSPTQRGAGSGRTVPDEVVRALRGQLDFERIEGVNDAVQIYRNTAWVPIRSVSTTSGGAGPVLPVLGEADGPASWQGELTSAGELRFAYPYDQHFRLEVDGAERPLIASGNFGLKADAIRPDALPARVRLTYDTPVSRRLLLGAQVVAWIAVAAGLLLWRDRLRRRSVTT